MTLNRRAALATLIFILCIAIPASAEPDANTAPDVSSGPIVYNPYYPINVVPFYTTPVYNVPWFSSGSNPYGPTPASPTASNPYGPTPASPTASNPYGPTVLGQPYAVYASVENADGPPPRPQPSAVPACGCPNS